MLLGVQHTVLFDRLDEYGSALRSLEAMGAVTRIVWPAIFPQLQPQGVQGPLTLGLNSDQVAMQHVCSWRYRHAAQWMLFIDPDEFIHPVSASLQRAGFLPAWIEGKGQAQQQQTGIMPAEFVLQSINFVGPNVPAAKLVIEQFTKRNSQPFGLFGTKGNRTKFIARLARMKWLNVHGVAELDIGSTVGYEIFVDPNREVRLNHYRRPTADQVGTPDVLDTSASWAVPAL